jgi:carbohydrate-selective porin OprB
LKVGNLYDGAAVRFNDVNVARAADYTLTIHYAADDERTGYISVNGGPEQLVGYFPRTGSWDTVGEYRVRVTLHAGTNTITYRTHAGPSDFPGPRTYSPDLDRITIGLAT